MHVLSAAGLSLAPFPRPVNSFGAAALDGFLYVYGGHQGERHAYSTASVSAALRRLPLEPGATWETLASTLPAQGTALVAHGRSLYRPGGMNPRNAPDAPGDLHSQSEVMRYDVDRGAWTEFVPLPEPRSSHDAVVLGDALYVGGGWALNGSAMGGTWRDTLMVIDLRSASPKWEGVEQPFRRRAHAMAALGEEVYFLGGIDDDGEPQRAVDIFHTRTGGWTKGPDLPAGPMNGFGGAALGLGERIYFSGRGGEVFALESGSRAWEEVGRLRHPRFFHRLVPRGTTELVVVGGEGDVGKLAELEVLGLRQ